MESVYLLIPVALLLVGVIVWAMFWAIRSGQFDDLEGPAHQILWDDDDRPPKREPASSEDTGSHKGKAGKGAI